MAHKVFVFVPAFGQTVTVTTYLTTLALQQHLASKSIQAGFSSTSFPDIAELRSMAMTIWYDTMPDSSHMLFIDSDMGFQPDMVTDMLMFDEPIVGSIYPQRKLPVSWAGSGTGEAVTERRGNFMKVEGVGMGCTLIRRDVVTKMLEQMPELVDTRLQLHPAGEMLRGAGTSRIIRAFEKLDLPERGLVSEDLSFCIRWIKCGGSVWASIGYRMSHVGPFDFGGRYLDTIEAQDAVAAQAALQPSAGGTTQTEPFVFTVPGAEIVPVPMPVIENSPSLVTSEDAIAAMEPALPGAATGSVVIQLDARRKSAAGKKSKARGGSKPSRKGRGRVRRMIAAE